ncbi:YifB family Mg chelatase-like AAA ATPase [Pseudodesulfovibrio sp. JC047]|uniref:YifB family Mg chelatase-like AAA ATPase n=1 Tax=Pseudodesulfovibrio sp. JC047 TaxID=2683199 RepID=UPI0013D4D60A|nr:YifB family Mg chelatase-like AAA ATPase [Pseudodesulfovibrio sp. JC047]NDV19934.1 YifB family Mg chelatase-like AAA ATPase [Pseudodesulfovibrio sp. JC047]
MIAKVSCAALMGIDAFKVELEVDFSRSGMPCFTMVGLAEGAVKESKERVFSALKNCGYKVPPARITVNLAPADVRKAGSAYDLPLAIGILVGMGVLSQEAIDPWFLAGELSLTGDLKSVPGVLPLALTANEQSGTGIIVPAANGREGAVVKDIAVVGATDLGQVVRLLLGEETVEPIAIDIKTLWNERQSHQIDFNEVKGQEHAKRAIEIAAAGGHNLLFIGPPGSGKTMLAKRIPTVLPPLRFEEALEVTKIYSVAGLLPKDRALLVTRPFRTPHHTISDVGLIGGGRYPQPGETSLAHRGVLFLDEMPEFKKSVLEVLRQPLEDGEVSISRSLMTLKYPADVMLVAAMNPCPCGYMSDDTHVCTCTPLAVQRYRGKISGPLLDRIDLHVDVPAVPYEDLKRAGSTVDSATMRARILAAREIQLKRYADRHFSLNASLEGGALEKFCELTEVEHGFLKQAVESLGLSARAYTRILRIARTIADLADESAIGVDHLAEAVNYRGMDREGGTACQSAE